MKSIKIIFVILCTLFFLVNKTEAAKGNTLKTTSFKVSGNCGMCKNNIESSLKIEGVKAALWNPDSKVLRVKYDSDIITVTQIHEHIAAAGYDTNLMKADNTAYNALTPCCQYRSQKCEHDAK